jgi:hypothetical protein
MREHALRDRNNITLLHHHHSLEATMDAFQKFSEHLMDEGDVSRLVTSRAFTGLM